MPPHFDELRSDVRFAQRSLRKDVRFTTVAILTLAVTVGGVALMLTLVRSVLLTPLPYPDPNRLVTVWQRDSRFPLARGRELRTADYFDWKTLNRSFDSIALYRRFVYDIDIDAQPVRAEIWSVTASLFPMLGARAAIGRLPDATDEEPGAPPVAVLSYEFWRDQFNLDRNVLGKTLSFPGNAPTTIVGVLLPGFQAPRVGSLVTSAQVGLHADPTFSALWQVYRPSSAELTNRNRGSHTGIARLKPNVSVAMALADLSDIARQLASTYPDTNSEVSVAVSPVIEEVSGSFKSVLWILTAAVFCVLLIGIGNLVNLQIVRNSARENELAIRAALGAASSRLVRQLMIEAGLLVLVAGVLASAVVVAALGFLLPRLPAGFPRVEEISIDSSVVLYVILICAAAGIVLGAIPSLRVVRSNIAGAFRETMSSKTATGRRSGLRHVVIATETALASLLLIGAGLLLNSWSRLVSTPTGMDESNVWTISMTLPPKYRTSTDQIAYFRRALDTVRQTPGVDSAGLVTAPPLAGLEMMWPNVLPEGDTTLRTGVTLSLRTVTPEYFDALRIPLVKGRLFSQSDTDTANRLGVLNESAARALFPDGNPIGRTIASYGTKYQVIGVIADVKMRRLDLAPSPQLYTSYLQMPLGSDAPVTMMVRGRYSDAKLGSVLRNAMASVDSEVQASVATMAQVRWEKTSAERFRTILSLVFAATAVSLSLIGVFGLVSYAVTQRSREIGIRMAIGANGRSVIRLMTRQSLIPAAVGLTVGTAASLWLSSFLTVFLYEISPTNATTFGVAITVFILSAFLASYFPARRAALIDPWKILRHD